MEMFLGFMVLLACLFLGIKHGGIGLAVISGIGLMAYTFLFGYKPGSPPIGVMLTIMAVVTCAGFLQTSGGLTVMLKYAERFLRNKPEAYHDSGSGHHMAPDCPLRHRPCRLHHVPDHL